MGGPAVRNPGPRRIRRQGHTAFRDSRSGNPCRSRFRRAQTSASDGILRCAGRGRERLWTEGRPRGPPHVRASGSATRAGAVADFSVAALRDGAANDTLPPPRGGRGLTSSSSLSGSHPVSSRSLPPPPTAHAGASRLAGAQRAGPGVGVSAAPGPRKDSAAPVWTPACAPHCESPSEVLAPGPPFKTG